MEYVSCLSKHWLEIVTAAYLIGMVAYGYHKGLVRLIVSATALLITLVTVKYAQPYVVEWIKQDTGLYENMKEKISENIGIDKIIEESESALLKDEKSIIDALTLPEQMKMLLEKNNRLEVYKEIGAEYFRDYVGGYLANAILKTAVFVALFIGVYFILQIVIIWLDLIAKLPILSGINKFAGALLNGIQAMIFIWIACLVFTLFSGTEIGRYLLDVIEASGWLSWIYDHNILSYVFLGLICTVW